MFFKQIGDDILEVSHKRIAEPKKSVYFNHIHNHCEILLFVCGEADYNIDGQIFRPKPYDVLFIPAATYHYLIPTASVAYENYVIGVDPSVFKSEHYAKIFSAPLMVSAADDGVLLDFFKRLDLYNEYYSDDDFDDTARGLIKELGSYLSYRKDALSAKSSRVPELVSRVIAFVAENIDKPLDSQVIASELLISRSHLQNIFSRDMHIGLKKYIMQKKIYAANAEIALGKAPTDAAAKYGFGDYSSFYRLYKATFGKSPRAAASKMTKLTKAKE